jgi:hypothetical protein
MMRSAAGYMRNVPRSLRSAGGAGRGERLPLKGFARGGTLSGVNEPDSTRSTASPHIAAGSRWRSRLGGTMLEVADRRPDGRFEVSYPAGTATGILSATTITELYEPAARADSPR